MARMENKKAIVIGAGVSGLSAAWELKKKGFEVTVLERRDAPGGVIRTFESGGFRAESGTNSVMVTGPRLLEFFEEIGLGAEVERSKPAAKKRFFVRGGKPRPVPSGPFSLLFTRLFSLFGKLRLLMEPFVGRSDPESEPSVQEFAERRLGKDVSDYAINPFMAGVYGIAEKKLRARELCDEFGLEPVMNKRAKTLSGGWQRRVSIAMALVNRPRLLFLDEPTLGLDVIARRELWEIIRSLRKNATIILTTHYMEEAQELSDRIAILEGGVLAACGSAGELCELAGAKDLESAFVKLATGGRLK